MLKTNTKTKQTQKRRKKSGAPTKPKVPYHRKPDGMSMEKWQMALRRQFAESQSFEIKNSGQGVVFYEYYV
jgi:hypothetical protein